MEEKVLELEKRVEALEISHEQYAKDAAEFNKNVKGLIEAFKALQGAWTVLEFIGKAAKPIAWIGALVGSVALFLGQRKS